MVMLIKISLQLWNNSDLFFTGLLLHLLILLNRPKPETHSELVAGNYVSSPYSQWEPGTLNPAGALATELTRNQMAHK